MNRKEIECTLISENKNKVKKIYDYIEEDINQNIKNIFEILFEIIKIKSSDDINIAIDNVSNICVDLNKFEYDKIFSMIKDNYLTAHYDIKSKGHQGLGYNTYSHSTASARRFPDSFNQYLTYMQVFDENLTDSKYYEIEQIAKEIVSYVNQRKIENTKFINEYNYLTSKKLIRKM